jgi:hypothetical protein
MIDVPPYHLKAIRRLSLVVEQHRGTLEKRASLCGDQNESDGLFVRVRLAEEMGILLRPSGSIAF